MPIDDSTSRPRLLLRAPPLQVERFVVDWAREIGRDKAKLDAALRVEARERDADRAKLTASLGELRACRGKHLGEQQRLLRAVGADDVPAGLLVRVRELDTLVAEADARIAAAERDLAALDVPSDAQAIRDALVEFDQLWLELDADERAQALALVLEEVIVNGETGEAELRLRGGL